jgi:uncharacterized lipoprotein YddW (UPF0748 family)
MHRIIALVTSLLTGCSAAPPPHVPEAIPPVIMREFRGVWVASVSNLDWPSRPGLTSDDQKAELIAILDKVRDMRMNAVILQVRPGGDALYASELEPWSEYLTGTMGVAPSPYYDPLEFAVAEAHKRGLELHAWFNPYRARHPSARGEIASSHLSRTRPDLVHKYGEHLWMDPAEPDVQKHSLAVILDVVKRYDVDGVHIDDYFYPYIERNARGKAIPFPDDASWNRYTANGGTLGRADFRRASVDTFIEQMYSSVKQVKPWVKVGISPFGIWRSGHPAQVSGLNAYDELYADSKKWLNNGWVDYFTPQLYWNIEGRQQSYPVLLEWWVSENTRQRHVWPGNAAHRVRTGAQNWPPEEIVKQIELTRENRGASGNVHFSMRNLMRNQGGVSDAIQQHAYTQIALPPRTPWLDADPPAAPLVTYAASQRRIRIDQPAGEAILWYVIWMRLNGAWHADVVSGDQKEYDVFRQPGVLPDVVVVSALDRSGNESRLARIETR